MENNENIAKNLRLVLQCLFIKLQGVPSEHLIIKYSTNEPLCRNPITRMTITDQIPNDFLNDYYIQCVKYTY